MSKLSHYGVKVLKLGKNDENHANFRRSLSKMGQKAPFGPYGADFQIRKIEKF